MYKRVKLRYGDLDKVLEDQPYSLPQLLAAARSVFRLLSVRLKYRDEEGDWVQLVQERDWACAQQTATEWVEVAVTEEALEALVAKVQLLLRMKPSKSLRDGLIRNLVRTEVYLSQSLPVPAVHINVKCDGCRDFPLFGARYRCVTCRNFDLCEFCEAKSRHPHDMIKIAKPITEDLEAAVVVSVGRPEMQFVQHLNLHPGSESKPGSVLVKEWQVCNTGTARWPADTHIVHTSGHFDIPPTEVLPLAPGQHGTLRVQVVLPQLAGMYQGEFRLEAQGEVFGDSLAIAVKAAAYRFADQLSELQNMGFEDVERLKTLLEQSRGNVQEVIGRLFRE